MQSSVKSSGVWLTGAELFLSFFESNGISGTMYSPYDFFLDVIILLQIYQTSCEKAGEFLIGIIGEIRIKFGQLLSYIIREIVAPQFFLYLIISQMHLSLLYVLTVFP